ncbi:MAG: YkgJ family cysteine cluster protein [Fervidicoccaceae archaeon]
MSSASVRGESPDEERNGAGGALGLDDLNRAAKLGLRGDPRELRRVLERLERYEFLPQIKFAAYALVAQFYMNTSPSTPSECEACGARCCLEGPPLPIYDFDLEELVEAGVDASIFSEVEGLRVLPRPCPLLRGWACSVQPVKPYACLSYPLATEDEQAEAMASYDGEGLPRLIAPESCPAAARALRELEELSSSLGREPRPLELLEALTSARGKP